MFSDSIDVEKAAEGSDGGFSDEFMSSGERELDRQCSSHLMMSSSS